MPELKNWNWRPLSETVKFNQRMLTNIRKCWLRSALQGNPHTPCAKWNRRNGGGGDQGLGWGNSWNSWLRIGDRQKGRKRETVYRRRKLYMNALVMITVLELKSVETKQNLRTSIVSPATALTRVFCTVLRVTLLLLLFCPFLSFFLRLHSHDPPIYFISHTGCGDMRSHIFWDSAVTSTNCSAVLAEPRISTVNSFRTRGGWRQYSPRWFHLAHGGSD